MKLKIAVIVFCFCFCNSLYLAINEKKVVRVQSLRLLIVRKLIEDFSVDEDRSLGNYKAFNLDLKEFFLSELQNSQKLSEADKFEIFFKLKPFTDKSLLLEQIEKQILHNFFLLILENQNPFP